MKSLVERLNSVEGMQAEVLFPEHDFMLRVRAAAGSPAVEWATQHRELLREGLLRYGVVLMRGLECDRRTFATVAEVLEPLAIDYTGGIGPRTIIEKDVFSIDLPAVLGLLQHNEMSYNITWPMQVMFFCEQPPAADAGGTTSVCDARQFLRDMDPAIRRPFDEHGIQYIRNFVKHLPYKSIQATFGTTDRDEIAAFCAKNGIEPVWLNDDHLQLRQYAPAIRRHPVTQEESFFTTLCTSHPACWWEPTKRAFPDAPEPRSEDEIWQTARYGNGERIPDEVMKYLERNYAEREYHVQWEKSDILYIDNMRASHGRLPFSGPRSILGSFRTPMTSERLVAQNNAA